MKWSGTDMKQRIPTANEMYFSERAGRPDPDGAAGAEHSSRASACRTARGRPRPIAASTISTRWCRTICPADRPLDVMDVAVSSGVSTVEWIESMESAWNSVPHDRRAMPRRTLTWCQIAPGLRVLVDRHGHALQYEVRRSRSRAPAAQATHAPVSVARDRSSTSCCALVVAPALKASEPAARGWSTRYALASAQAREPDAAQAAQSYRSGGRRHSRQSRVPRAVSTRYARRIF